MSETILAALDEGRRALDKLMEDETTISAINQAGELLSRAFLAGNRAFSCGNGGSMCDAMHFAEELSGRFRSERSPLPASAISDPSFITCTANDYGYESIFSRQIECQAKPGDVLLAISTSGNSPNVLEAAKMARDKGVTVLALTGKTKSKLEELADIVVCTPVGRYSDRVQELHIKVIHILIELVERELFPENY